MIPLVDKPNVVTPDSDYPYGRTKDDDGSNNGTPLNTLTHGDLHQFFEKLMDEADVTPNGLPDNAYSGFQLFEALDIMVDNPSWRPASELTFANSWTNSNIQFKKNIRKVSFRGAITRVQTGFFEHNVIVFTLPINYRPPTIRCLSVPILGTSAQRYKSGVVEIDTDGTVILREDSRSGSDLSGSGDFLVYFDGLEFYL